MLFQASAVVLGLIGLTNAGASTYSQEICFTSFGHRSITPVPTSTSAATLHLPAFVKTTYTPSITITPAQATSTSTVFSTTTLTTSISQVTDTFTATSTIFTTSTITSSSTFTTTTSTETTITTTSTSTVPTVAGFTPIASAVGAGNTASKRKRDIKQRRDALTRASKRSQQPKPVCKISSGPGGKEGLQPPQNPEKIQCDELIEIISTTTFTKTASNTATITAPQNTATVTSTSTISTTSTATVPDASSTVTVSTTSTITTTTTDVSTVSTTTTGTSTVAAPAATTYAACAANNMINYVNSVPISIILFDNGVQSVVQIDSGYDCCASCQKTADCGGYAFFGGTCYLISTANGGTTCDPSTVAAGFQTSTEGKPFTIGNSGCGTIAFRGDADSS